MATSANITTALSNLEAAQQAGQLTAGAVTNIRVWLSEPRYADYAEATAAEVLAGNWKQLDDAFWTIIPFGTGGRRGKMYPIGSNSINDRTIGESAQGLADYVLSFLQSQQAHGIPSVEPPGCALAYDTRHNSRHFAELCAEVMVANGFQVFFLDGYRSTPELSFATRYKQCACGIMVTASHNPPSDNAVKAYWSTGGQLLPPHDAGVIDRVMSCQQIKRVPFADAVTSGRVVMCEKEVDAAFIAAVVSQAQPGPRELSILYTPLHGVGASAVIPALEADGFKTIEIFGPHAEPNGDFPNVFAHVANPENPAVFDLPIERAKAIGADIVLATDPDCDRLGVAAPLTTKAGSPWGTLTGNQIGALLTDFLCERRKAAGSLTKEHYLVKTLVTTEMIRRIGDSYGVRTEGDLQVGFKYIGGVMDELGPDKFVFGTEESHGYLAGKHARDKDAAVAAMLLSELAAACKAKKQTLHEKLDSLFWQFGYHLERQVAVTMPGSEGMRLMAALIEKLRRTPPSELGGMKVALVRDYKKLEERVPRSPAKSFAGPTGDMVMIYLEQEGTYVAVRPSGTEPKVKFYQFAYEPAEQLHNLEATKEELTARLKKLADALADFSKT